MQKKMMIGLFLSSSILVGCNDSEKGIKDTSNAYYGDFLSSNVFVVNLDKMSLEKTITGGLGPYGLEPIGHNYLVSLTRKDTSVDVIDIRTKEIKATFELGYQPREVATNPSKTYTVVSGRDIPAHSLFNTQTGNVVRHFNRNQPHGTITDFGGANATGHPFFVNDSQYLILDRSNRQIRLYHVLFGLQDTLNTPTTTHHILRKGNDLYVSMEGSGSSNTFVSPGVLKLNIWGSQIVNKGIAYLENTTVASMGIHHINFHYDGRHIYTGSNNGLVYVIDTKTMRVVDTFASGKGGGHTDFSPKYKRAVVSNHKSNFVTLVNVSNPRNNRVIKQVVVANSTPGVSLQGHTQAMSDDENHFYGTATADGIFFEMSMRTGDISRTLDLGGELQQGFMFQSPEGGFANPAPKFASGTFFLKSALTAQLLTSSRSRVNTSYWASLQKQGWDIRVRHDGFVNLVNRRNKKCLQQSGSGVVMRKCNNTRNSQMWTLRSGLLQNQKHIVSRANNRCLASSYYGRVRLNSCSFLNYWNVEKAF